MPLAVLLLVGCGDSDDLSGTGGHGGDGGASAAGATASGSSGHAGLSAGAGGAGASDAGAGGMRSGDSGAPGLGDAGNSGVYSGPSVGRAKSFAALAYSAITAANISPVSGDIGVSAGAMSNITGFDAPTDVKYGTDSLAPNDQRTIVAQQDVTALVGDIDPRACDTDLTDVVGGLTGDITLYPGVTCMNSFSADVLVNGKVTLDAQGDPNAFFVIRGNLTLTVADGAQVVLSNGAQACGVFWRIAKQITVGKTAELYGTLIAGTAITMNTGSTLAGRALAQTAGVTLDANSITTPSSCTHLQ
jgi:hypothetical protein